MKNIFKYIIGVTLLLLVVSGCTSNYDTYNINPYEPTDANVPALFAELQDCFVSPEENPTQRNNTFWACFGGYVTAPHSWSRSTLYSTYNIDDAWNDWTVSWYYNHFYPSYYKIEEKTEKSGMLYALAVLHRVAIMQYVVNLQGPLPYSKMNSKSYTVAYDDEETAWYAMFDDLDYAIKQMTMLYDPEYSLMKGYDRVYDGDFSKWIKFANSLRLRMAIRISDVAPEYAKKQAQEAFNNEFGVMTDNSESAYDNLKGRYSNGYFIVGDGWGEARVNATITSYMNGYNDPRRDAYFTEATVSGQKGYIGVRSGIQGANSADFKEYSKFKVEAKTPMPFFYASEVAFLCAEAALKGWGFVGGTAQEWYEKGIKLSFSEYNISGADDYIKNGDLKPGVFNDPKYPKYNYTSPSTITIKWDENATKEEKLERIITQKWIANFPISLEAWCDFRRTGYPYIFPAYNNLSTQGVTNERQQRRLRFTQSEYGANPANVAAAAKFLSNGQDTDNTDLWWAKKK